MKKVYCKPTLEVNDMGSNNLMCASGVDSSYSGQGITWDASVDDDTNKPSYKPFKPWGGLDQF